jgi:TatD DNase family protein
VKVVDSHCHLDDERFDGDREEVIARAFAEGLEHLLAVGTGDGPPDLEAGLRVAALDARILATVGVHPHAASQATEETWVRLWDLLQHPKVVALGEIGLDYHYDFSPREVQQAVFRKQMELAAEARKPVVIHTREAWDDTVAMLREMGIRTGIMHCFTGNAEQAEQALGMGFYISFAGVVTFPKAIDVQEAARCTPLDRLLVETDAPYLAPAPHRGKRNEPAFVIHTARKVAELKGCSFEEIASATTANFKRLCLPQGEHSK